MNSFKVFSLLVSALVVLSTSQVNAEETPFQVLYKSLTEGYEKGLKTFQETFGIKDDDKLLASVKALTVKFTEVAQNIAKGIEKDSKPLAEELQQFVEKTTSKTSEFVKKTLESPESKAKLEELKSYVEKIVKPLEEAVDKFAKSAGATKPLSVTVKSSVEEIAKNLEKFRLKTLESIEKAIQDAKKHK